MITTLIATDLALSKIRKRKRELLIKAIQIDVAVIIAFIVGMMIGHIAAYIYFMGG